MARASSILLLCLALAAAVSPPALAQWIDNGVPVCGSVCVADAHHVIPDGAGGIYVGWRESRDYPVTQDDCYAQRLTAAGTVAAGWLPTGVPVSVEPYTQSITAIASDGAGGLLLTWLDGRDQVTGSNGDLYAQRLLPDGTIVPGWQVNGTPVALGPYQDRFGLICSDGAGGAFIAWWRFFDVPNEPYELINAYAQHLLADGGVAPGWPANGMPICGTPGDQLPMAILPDGAGGAAIVWNDGRAGNPDLFDTYALRLQADGSPAPGWPVDGAPILLGKDKARVASDGAGGFYVGAATPGYLPGSDKEYYVQHFTFAGTPAPGWPEGGVLAVSAPDLRGGLEVAADGLGGLLLTWFDTRFASFEIFVLRLQPDGTRPPGWPEDGVLVSDLLSESAEVTTRIAPDGFGGAYAAWERDPQVIMQHLDAQGAVAPGWAPGGAPVARTSGQFDPRPASDGAGGAILVWEEASRSAGRLGIYAQRFGIDGPVAVELALASAEATPERVALVWHGPGAGALEAAVERRRESDDWQEIGAAAAAGADRLRYEDRRVVAGERYAYRLAYKDEGIERHTVESWVEVPRALELSLEGFRPNPVVGPPVVAFTLPTAAPARLDVLDVTGRRVLTRDVGALGAGRHTLRLSEGPPLAPGVYLILLRQGARVLHMRGVVTR
jgi:hypothetical protein